MVPHLPSSTRPYPTGPAPPRGGSGFAAGGAAPGASALLLLSPFSFSSGLWVGGQGIESPEAARVGRAMGGGDGFL
jgi:hypothetical protein